MGQIDRRMFGKRKHGVKQTTFMNNVENDGMEMQDQSTTISPPVLRKGWQMCHELRSG